MTEGRPAAIGSAIDLKLTAIEIIELAIWIERKGVEFYRFLSEEMEEADMRSFFLRLMGMEMRHESRLRSALKDFPQREEIKSGFDEGMSDREYFLRLKTLAGAKVFPEGFNILLEMEDYKEPEDALPMALEIEENTRRLYGVLSGFELPAEVASLVRDLIRDEGEHVSEIKGIIGPAAKK